MTHKKKPQRLTFSETGVPNSPPRWRPKGLKRPQVTEKLSDETKQRLLSALNTSVDITIRNNIAKTNSEEQLPGVKNKIKGTTPRGVVSKAEKEEGVISGTLDKLLRQMGGEEGRVTKRLWIEYVDSRFDIIAQEYEYVKGEKGKNKAVLVPSSASTESSSGNLELIPDDISTFSSFIETNDDDTIQEQYQTCSTFLYPLLRDGIDEDIKQHFIQTLEQRIDYASDYIKDFVVQLMKIMSLFKSRTFVKTNDGINFQTTNGRVIAELIPSRYISTDISHVPSSLNLAGFTDTEIRAFNNLFTRSHFQLIHSTYFGVKGVTSRSLDKQPFHEAIIRILPRDYPKAFTTDPTVMKNCLSTYVTNIENMFSDKARISRMIKNLIDTLLLVKLSPTTDQKRLALLKEKKALQVAHDTITQRKNTPKSRNRLRNIFCNQQSKRKQYLQNANFFSNETNNVETEDDAAELEGLKGDDDVEMEDDDVEMDLQEGVQDTSASYEDMPDAPREYRADLRKAIRRLLFNYGGKTATQKKHAERIS
jgi:hypothetical protein